MGSPDATSAALRRGHGLHHQRGNLHGDEGHHHASPSQLTGTGDSMRQSNSEAPSRGASGAVGVMSLAVVTTIVLLISGFAYLSGSDARTTSDYAAVAGPADQTLAAELGQLARDQHGHIVLTDKDL